MVTLTLAGETLRATARHPFLVVRGTGLDERPVTEELGADNAPGVRPGRWVEAQHLRSGDVLACRRGEVAVEGVSVSEESLTVYNLHVAESRTYAVGACGVVVHNASPPSGCCDPPEGYAKSLGTTTVSVSWFNRQIVRADAAEALVTAASVEKGGSEFTTGPNSPPWWSAMTSNLLATPPDQWERGHLIGNQLGGPGRSNWWNMVPLHDKANAPGMLNCEKKIRKAAEEGHCVKVTVTAIYGNRQAIPIHIRMHAVSLNGDFSLGPVTIPNRSSATSPCA